MCLFSRRHIFVSRIYRQVMLWPYKAKLLSLTLPNYFCDTRARFIKSITLTIIIGRSPAGIPRCIVWMVNSDWPMSFLQKILGAPWSSSPHIFMWRISFPWFVGIKRHSSCQPGGDRQPATPRYWHVCEWPCTTWYTYIDNTLLSRLRIAEKQFIDISRFLYFY